MHFYYSGNSHESLIMSCTKSIVECLRDKGRNPTAFASNEKSSSLKATYALDYNSNSQFQTETSSQQNWTVDFTQTITITKYNIKSEKWCNWIKYWRASVSDDNSTWKIVDSPPQEFPGDKNYTIDIPISGRYFRIEGLNGNCGYPFSFYYVKFFGSLLKLSSQNACTCKKKRTIENNILRIIFLLCS